MLSRQGSPRSAVRDDGTADGCEDHRSPRCSLTFYDCPAGRWVHLRTAKLIASIFATVRLRQRVTRGDAAPEPPVSRWRSSSSSSQEDGGEH